ncbi:MAG: YggT family protein [Dehalococcoidia bacterium]|jgi:YggT family protein|nr:YggT family protein [Chloroflexota bacterium]MCK4243185.1 YggT family protein [Dehalococcoidia bacterium]
MSAFREFIAILCNVLALIIFIRAILTWFPISRRNPIVAFLDYITEPILAPLRRIIPRIGMIDITPMIAIIILLIIASII